MDLRDLAYFRMIAELGHLGRAAEALHRTKPALTKCIRRLEASLGTRLFRREGRRILLTEVGEVLLRRAGQMRALVDDTAMEIAKVADGSVGHVRIGTGPTVAEYILPDLFARVMQKHPKLTIEITVGLGNALRAALVDNRVDVIVSTILPSDGDLFSAYHFATDEVVVVASPRHPLVRRRIGAEDLLAYKWVLPDRSVASRQWIDGVFATRGLRTPEVLVETGSLQLLPILIERTDVLGFTPRSNLLPGRIAAPLAELPLEATTMRRQIGVLYRKVPDPSPALMKLLQIVQSTNQVLSKDIAIHGRKSRTARLSGKEVAKHGR
ncbi:LysR family transcriptional regulator [Xanthobacteraceae bacterium Astr-EGSB]|uniref:LysR family transcriptional regulator n=1 Tax=Astrobacterium formosum TaxID=3069710 RepID=UPI0027B10821|nr:LysR family transcriptional regulator [Xanthobacteraceae bacterium Astr-EGSB]